MPNLWSSEVNEGHSITSKSGVKSGRIGLWLCSIIYMPQFFTKKNYVHKISSTNNICTI